MMERTRQCDLHVLRYFSSFVTVSEGRVVHVTDPEISFCPLAGHLYKGFKTADRTDKEALKREIKKAVESKIEKFGHFTPRRVFSAVEVAIPYGASEMLMSALDKKIADAAVVVCDGAGTVVADKGSVVQGIGARMNSLLTTSPIDEIRDRLAAAGCHVVFENALIDQVKGVETAVRLGYKKIAVTVCGRDAAKLAAIRRLETRGAHITILSVCNTSINRETVSWIKKYADIVWSCASREVRSDIGSSALLQISKLMPVFVLTQRGMELVSGRGKIIG